MTAPLRVGLTLLTNADDSPLSPHFGKAKWLGIYDGPTGRMRFVRNTGLIGRSVARVFAEAACTHVVFANIGAGALEHLKSSGLRPYWGQPGVAANALVQQLQRGELSPAEIAGHRPERQHRQRQRA